MGFISLTVSEDSLARSAKMTSCASSKKATYGFGGRYLNSVLPDSYSLLCDSKKTLDKNHR